MDIFLLVVICIMAFVLLFVNFYLLAIYCHPDDRGWGTGLFCKVLVVFGLTLSWAQVLLLPADVSNSRGYGGEVDMALLWMICYGCVIITVTILLPFAIFMYETDEEKSFGSRVCNALFMLTCSIIISCLIIFISWAFLKFALIPVELLSKEAGLEDSKQYTLGQTGDQISTDAVLEYKVSFIVYVMALLSWVGWFLFATFGGIGLSALPMDMIIDFQNRPKLRSTKEAKQTKVELQNEVKALISESEKVKKMEMEVKSCQEGFWETRKKKKNFERFMNKFKANVLMVEKKYDVFKIELDYLGSNPLVWWGKLILGLILSIVSFMLWLHILLYLVIAQVSFQQTAFLNDMLTGLDSKGIAFLSTAIFAFLAVYMLLCTTKGVVKVGIRIPWLINIHVMKQNETLMNSFLFNVLIVLICSVSVVQFSATAFDKYTRLSTINMMFNTQIRYLKFFRYFYDFNVFPWMLLIWSLIVFLYLLVKPIDRFDIEKKREEIMKRKNEF